MKISSSRKILLEEVPAAQKGWFEKIVNVINPYLDQSYRILTQGITIGDNLKAQKLSLSVEVGQVYPIEAAYTLNEKPYAVHVASIRENNSTSQAVQKHSMTWYIENNVLKIYFDGLDTAKSYIANLYTLI